LHRRTLYYGDGTVSAGGGATTLGDGKTCQFRQNLITGAISFGFLFLFVKLFMLSQSRHRGSGTGGSTPASQEVHVYRPLLATADETQPVSRDTSSVTTTTDSRPSRSADNDEIDNVNEGHNHFVVLTSTPGSATQRQAQACNCSTTIELN